MWRYRLFGVTLASDIPLTLPPLDRGETADLTFSLSSQTFAPDLEGAQLLYEGLAFLYRTAQGEILRFPQIADFLLGFDRILARGQEGNLESPLLGPVLSYWLEQQGLPTLHASAVTVGAGAVAFLSRQGGGKTGLAAAMMRHGCALLTDDVLPIEEQKGIFLGRPGYPQMRMWPDEAAHFLAGWEELPLVHPASAKRRVPAGGAGLGAFHASVLPLSCLYIPERRPGGDVEIHELSPQQAFIELVRHSFSPRLVEAAGLQEERTARFARLVRQVPVRRLLYPSGFDRLDRVAEAVLAARDKINAPFGHQ